MSKAAPPPAQPPQSAPPKVERLHPGRLGKTPPRRGSWREAPEGAASRTPLLAYAIAIAVIALDQLSKWWVLGPLGLPERGQIAVVPHLFDLTLVHNSGVSFGLFHAGAELGRWLLTGFSLAVAAGLAWWARTAARPLVALAIGLVIGGAVGNAVDRIRLGEVTDFLDASGLHFPWVFNLADSAISVGVAVLLLDSLLAPRPQPSAGRAAEKRP